MNRHICLSNCKSTILYVLVACCIVSIGYSKVFEIETVFTHLFYIPIVLAGIWWRSKGIFVALLLALALIASDIISYGFTSSVLLRDVVRALMFCAVAIVTDEAYRHEQEVVDYAASLEETVASGTMELKETKDYLHDLFYNMPVGIVAMDNDMRITGFNRALMDQGVE